VITEIAVIDVAPGREDDFMAIYPTAHKLLVASPGFLSGRMTRGVESSSRFVSIIEWESVEAHLKNFAETERFTEFAALLMPLLAGPPSVGHYADIPTTTA
jgi:heme-degrading monooxygenase HmoA